MTPEQIKTEIAELEKTISSLHRRMNGLLERVAFLEGRAATHNEALRKVAEREQS